MELIVYKKENWKREKREFVMKNQFQSGRLTELKQDYEDSYFESRDNDDKMISI